MNHTGDHLDVLLRLDGLRAAVGTTLDLLADGNVAEAQVTLGHAFNIEAQACEEEVADA